MGVGPPKPGRAGRDRRARLLLVGARALAETVIAPIPMPAWTQVLDSRGRAPPVYAWRAAQPGEPVVAELPIPGLRGHRHAARLTRKHLSRILHASLEAPRERLRRHRAF